MTVPGCGLSPTWMMSAVMAIAGIKHTANATAIRQGRAKRAIKRNATTPRAKQPAYKPIIQ